MEILLNIALITLGLLALILAIAGVLYTLSRWSLDIRERQLKLDVVGMGLRASIPMPNLPPGLSSKLAQMKQASSGHPEVDEIEESDEIVGVAFVAEDENNVSFPGSAYPPAFDEDDEDVDD